MVVRASNFFLHKDAGFLSNGPIDENTMKSFLGKACYVGDSAFITGNATNDNEIAIGPLPPTSRGCVLYLGQHSRILQPRLPNSQGIFSPSPSPGFKNTLQFTLFGTSECILGPSTIISSLHLAYADIAESSLASSTNSTTCSSSRDYINYLLHTRQNDDVIFSALRMIVLQTVNALASMAKRPNRHDTRAFAFAKALLREVVTTTKSILPPLIFCRFFLGLGRQLEPHDFSELFPLPYYDVEMTKQTSLPFEILFQESMRCGSIAVTSAALPLFSSGLKSLTWCKHLLWQCLHVVRENINENTSIELDQSSEEREFILQLYKFGVKLEDVNHAESTSVYSDGKNDNDVSLDASSNLYDSYVYSDDDDVSSSSRVDEEIQLQPRSRMSRFVSMITPMIWDTTPAKPSKDEMEEKAIADAASMFIYSAFDEGNDQSKVSNIDGSVLTVVEEEVEEIEQEEEERSNWVTEVVDGGASHRAKFEVPSLVDRSIAGVVCEHLVNEFHEAWRLAHSDPCSLSSWTAIAYIAALMCEGRGDLPSQAIADFRNILQTIPEEDLAQYARPGTNVLIKQIDTASHHLRDHDAGYVFDLIVLLLHRHEMHQDVQEYAVPLIVLAIIVGEIAGRLEGVLVSPIDSWYSACT